MKVVPPSDTHYQCPKCGVPLDWLESVHIATVRLGPCEHEVSIQDLGLQPIPGEMVSGYFPGELEPGC